MRHYERFGFGDDWTQENSYTVDGDSSSYTKTVAGCPDLQSVAVADGGLFYPPNGWTVKQMMLTQSDGSIARKDIWVSPSGQSYDLEQCSSDNIRVTAPGMKTPVTRVGDVTISWLPWFAVAAGIVFFTWYKTKR